MKKQVILCSVILFGMSIGSFALSNTDLNDSLKNEITFSQDRIGYFDCSFKYSHKLKSNLWLKVGLIELGNYLKTEPKENHAVFTTRDRQLSFGLVVGLDKHSYTVLNGLDVIYGLDMRFIYSNYKYSVDNPNIPVDSRTSLYHDYKAGIGFTLGFFYNFSKRFAIGSELKPYIVYLERVYDNSSLKKQRGFEYDLFSNVSIISLRYRW